MHDKVTNSMLKQVKKAKLEKELKAALVPLIEFDKKS